MAKGKKLAVYGFMRTPHTMVVITETGVKCFEGDVDSLDEAKTKLMSKEIELAVIEKTGRTDQKTIWSNDPAADETILAAWTKAEQAPTEETERTDPENVDLEAFTGETGEARFFAEGEPGADGYVPVHTLGKVFYIKAPDGSFVEIGVSDLKIDDVVHYEETDRDGVSVDYQVVATAINTGEENSGDFIIQLRQVPESDNEELLTEPQVTTCSKKVIEVECPMTYSEQEIRRIGCDLYRKKDEALASAAEYREEIKELEKLLKAAVQGKAYTHMECDVVNDWEAGERSYIRPDTGEVVKREQISMEERQLNMDAELAAATPKPEITGENVDNSDASEPEIEAPAEEVPEHDVEGGEEVVLELPEND